MSSAREFTTDTITRQLGTLAKRRREEIGLNRTALAKEAGIESEQVIQDFEFGRSLPPVGLWRKLEMALGWKLGIIQEVSKATGPREPLSMEGLDAEDSLYLAAQAGTPSLTSATDGELLNEVARRGL